MKILLLLSESWNDTLFPNNNMTNWFTDFNDVEIWTISGSGELPQNNCCTKYFLVSEITMIKSLFTNQKSGKIFDLNKAENNNCCEKTEVEISRRKVLKQLFASEFARLCRDIVWRYGRYDMQKLNEFIEECNPDIIFSQRKGSIKMCRLENLVGTMTQAPMIAYTGDDEYSLRQFSLSPFFWIRRFWVRAWLKKTIPQYKLFYSQSERQMKEFELDFNVPTKFLVKCGEFEEQKIHREINNPIQLVYAGKLYCNRWKTLQMVADIIKKINEESGLSIFQLQIYTGDYVKRRYKRILDDGRTSIINKAVPVSKLLDIYSNSDIVLHVESLDIKNRLLTQDSFSTKVIDCLASGCAVMAVCWEQHAAYRYLKKKGAAFVATSKDEVYKCLNMIKQDPHIIIDYAKEAYNCGNNHHKRKDIQKQLLEDCTGIIQKNNKN